MTREEIEKEITHYWDEIDACEEEVAFFKRQINNLNIQLAECEDNYE